MKPIPLILLNKDSSALSETFIQNHIDYFKSPVVNYNKLLPRYSNKKNVLLRKIDNKFITNRSKQQLKQLQNKHGINCVLAEYGMVGADICFWCKENNIPLIVHFHGHDAHRKSVLEKYQTKYSQMFQYASAIIVVSNTMKQSLEGIGAPKNKLFLNGYGVDLKKFNYKERDFHSKQIFAIGRFVDKKAPYLLILAFQKVLLKHPDFQLRIAGDGYLFETCSRIVSALNLTDSIKLLGAIPHQEVNLEMSKACCYVQHSVTAFDGDSEGLPNTILEAAASGVPIVATPHAGIADVLTHEVNALICAENNVDEMADCINRFIEDQGFAKSMAENALKSIKENHILEDTLLKLENIMANSF